MMSANSTIDESSAQPTRRPASAVAASVVVPMFNESECVDSLIRSLTQVEASLAESYDFEFLLIDDGSSDHTVALLEAAVAALRDFRVVRHGANTRIGAAMQ